MGSDEVDEPLLVLGEAKNFGIGSINDEAIDSLRTVAERFAGAVIVVSSLRAIQEYGESIESAPRAARWRVYDIAPTQAGPGRGGFWQADR